MNLKIQSSQTTLSYRVVPIEGELEGVYYYVTIR